MWIGVFGFVGNAVVRCRVKCFDLLRDCVGRQSGTEVKEVAVFHNALPAALPNHLPCLGDDIVPGVSVFLAKMWKGFLRARHRVYRDAVHLADEIAFARAGGIQSTDDLVDLVGVARMKLSPIS